MYHAAPLISLKGVALAYVQRKGLMKKTLFWPLKEVSFDVYPGETLGIIGVNGAGKSSLLRLLAGIVSPDRGEVVVKKGSNISLLALQLGFIPYLTGRENAVLSGILFGLNRASIEEKLNDIIAFADLGDFIDQPVVSYSSGMKARLGFSVAFHAEPDIMLIDEVLGVGDEAFRKKSTHAMHQRIYSDKTVVIVSHNMLLLRKICHRVIWIHDGYVHALGKTPDVINAYLDAVGAESSA